MNLEKIRDIANKKTSRVVATALLVLAGKAAISNTEIEGKNIDTKEISSARADRNAKVSKENTYIVSGEEMREMEVGDNFELVKMDFDVNYETDKADLEKEQQEEIINQFTTFLESVGENNYSAVKEADWEVVSACDERATNLWGEKGNEALATARGESVINTLYAGLKDYEFKNLNEEQVKVLKNKEIKNAIVSIHEDRKGEILIEDIINPQTDKNYTKTEVEEMKKNEKEKYHSLLAQNRISQFRAEVPVEKLEEMNLIKSVPPLMKRRPELKTIETIEIKHLIKIFPEYKNVILLLDDSPSMRDDKKMLSQEIEDQQNDLVNTKLFIGHYSDKLKKLQLTDNNKVSENILEEVGGGENRELSVQAVIEAWKQIGEEIESNEKTLILVNTDEALQRFSAKDLDNLNNLPSNIEIRFVFHQEDGMCMEVPLNVVQSNFDKVINDKTIIIKKSLENLEKYLLDLHRRRLSGGDRSSLKHIDKLIKGVEKQRDAKINTIIEYSERLANKKITLDRFTDDNGEKAQLNVY